MSNCTVPAAQSSGVTSSLPVNGTLSFSATSQTGKVTSALSSLTAIGVSMCRSRNFDFSAAILPMSAIVLTRNCKISANVSGSAVVMRWISATVAVTGTGTSTRGGCSLPTRSRNAPI